MAVKPRTGAFYLGTLLAVVGLIAAALLNGGPSARVIGPLQKRAEVPDFPAGHEWLNSRPLSKDDLKGKFVLLDFWTYCCINCMHILPELEKLEKKYPNELVVVGVHSAKFEGEKQTDNIREAIQRYEIAHPVINDDRHLMWSTFEVDTWPTIVLIDPEGKFLWRRSGEFKAEEVEAKLKAGIATHKRKGTLSREPLKLDLESAKLEDTPLRFPGKVLADRASNRLFIADSNHNRIVVASLDGKLHDVIGSGVQGKADGNYETATFHHPQGMAIKDDLLYVADNENHMLRKVDLKARKVVTIAGDGEQNPGPKQVWSRGKPRQIKLSSPWDLWIHDDDLYIAMAGPHQIWRMRLDESQIAPFAGNGQEDIVDGPLLPDLPYKTGFSSFAQPSGLTSDGTHLFVADSEGSSIRAITLTGRMKEVTTVIGTSGLPKGQRLFYFGDRDGPKPVALLQHCLAVAYDNGVIFVADTYNNKIKAVDAQRGVVATVAGTGDDGLSDNPPTFDEPGGLSIADGQLYVADTNNHAIRIIDLSTKQVSTLAIDGLTPPVKQVSVNGTRPDFTGAAEVKLKATAVKPIDGKITLEVEIALPEGWKTNPLGKPSYWIDSPKAEGPLDRSAFGRKKLTEPSPRWEIEVPVSGKGSDTLRIATNYYYCQKLDEGVCKVGAVVFTIPVSISDSANQNTVQLKFEAPE